MLRGRREEFLFLDIEVDSDNNSAVKPVEQMVAQLSGRDVSGAAGQGKPSCPGWFC